MRPTAGNAALRPAQNLSRSSSEFEARNVEARQSRAERRLVGIKAALMSADYRGDLTDLAALRTQAAEISDDSHLGYLADYWSGFASWRIVVNGASSKLSNEDARANLDRAVVAFESSIRKNTDFADGYASAAAVHGWLLMSGGRMAA